MKKTKIAVIALLVLCLLTGATAIVGNLETVGASTPTTQLSMNEPLTAEQVYALIQSDPNVVIIDARDNAEYTGTLPTPVSEGHLPGAYSVPDDRYAAEKLYRFPEKNRPYISYCNDPSCGHAWAVASLLLTSGYTNVTYMPGGVADWAAQGYNFETGKDIDGVIPPANGPPTVMSIDASVTSSSAQLNGNLTSLGTASSVTVSFEWGPTASYGNSTKPEAKSEVGAFTASLTGLTPANTYHFRVKAVGNGTTYSRDATFTTAQLPASFTLTNFNITPSTPKAGGIVNISVTCTNTGGISGTYPVALKINGASEQREEVSLDPGKSQLVTFAITKSKSGTYEANVNELTSSFVIQKSPKSYWPLVLGILGGLIVVGLLVLYIFRHRKVSYNERFWK